MRERIEPGVVVDGFRVGACIHKGGTGSIYRVDVQPSRDPGFPIVIKSPLLGRGESSIGIDSFEMEKMILPTLGGAHVPRFVQAGDVTATPYIVMEWIDGRSLAEIVERAPLPPGDVAHIGAALADAVQSVHEQEVIHLDLKPENFMLRPDGSALLLDFGFARHARYPDLLAEEQQFAAGSAAYVSPEQLQDDRGDPRSDIFAIGVMLYELTTGELPFGEPQTEGGLRQRLWMDPVPPRALRPDLPGWLQEVILRCLEPEAARRQPSAAHLAFDLGHPEQVTVGPRGERPARTSWRAHLRRWVKAAGMHYQPSPRPSRRIEEVPIVMAAVPHHDVSDATLYSLREQVNRSLGVRPGARLACVTVVAPISDMGGHTGPDSAQVHRQHLEQLRQWSRGLDLEGGQVSYHVLESGDVAQALLAYAEANQVSLIVMGAATHGLAMRRWIPTVPARVAAEANCSVLLVKQGLPFWALAEQRLQEGEPAAKASIRP